jgi:hypothetical protein
MRRLLAIAAAVSSITAVLLAQTKPAVPLEPIAAILEAFRTHDIVALGEGRHNNVQGYRLRLVLIRDSRFAAIVNDIVVESGSSMHQAVMDRFIAGEAKKRRALVVYGDGHFARRPPGNRGNIVTRLLTTGASVLSLWTHTTPNSLETMQSGVESWPVPSLAYTAGTTLGAGSFNSLRAVPAGEDTRVEEQFDAVLYLGPYSGITIARGDIAASLCADVDYIKMRLSRMALIEAPGSKPPPGVMTPAERLKRCCETVAKR